MARFVDHEIHEIGEEKAGCVAEGVEEEERIEEKPGEAGEAGDGGPGLCFGERELHGNRVTTENVLRGVVQLDVAREERGRLEFVEDFRLRFGN
jgi:hypothetical protein